MQRTFVIMGRLAEGDDMKVVTGVIGNETVKPKAGAEKLNRSKPSTRVLII